MTPFPRAGVPGIIFAMSPTVFREGGFRFYFFSREESRLHVHVQGQSGEAKFWLEPVALAKNVGFSAAELSRVEKLVWTHETRLREAWNEFFGNPG